MTQIIRTTMAAITPSPRRSAFKTLNEMRSRGAGSDGESHHGIPLPPLYYKKRDEYEENDAGRGLTNINMNLRNKDPVSLFKTPEKNKGAFPVSRSPFPTTKTTFVPIDRPPLFRSNATPPISPVVGKKLHTTTSPAPSLMSLSLTEDGSEGSLTPIPTTSYLQVASVSPSPGQYRHSGASLPHRFGTQSPVGKPFGAPLSPHKSPYKYFQHRRSNGAASPLPFSSSSHQSNTPYSPGGSSIGSHSTSTEDVARKQRVKTELCMHYSSGRVCPFGLNCTYAHGEAELQMTKLMDLQRAGLIEDVDTYRTKPCLTWVATGSW